MDTPSEIVRTKLIPWSRQNASERFIIARRHMRQAEMPYGVELVAHKIQSKRVIIKNKRTYNNVRNVIAEWPEEGLNELSKYQLVCVLDGHINYQLGNYKVRCGAGHFIFVPPKTPLPNGKRTYVDLEKGSSSHIITFLLHSGAMEYWASLGNPHGRTKGYCYLLLNEHVISVFRALMSEVFSDDESQVQVDLLRVFFAMLHKNIVNKQFHELSAIEQSENLRKNISPEDFLTRLEYYVQSNLNKPLTLEVVSREMYCSQAQFTRNVRRETGKSFGEFLAVHRLNKAKELLTNSDWTVNTIVMFVGLKSPNYFRNFFKRHEGMTPTEFRRIATNIKNTLK